jgi:hypothetical protein
MNGEIRELYAKLDALKIETANLRLASLVAGRRYEEAHTTIRELTRISLDAARRAATAAENAVLATKKAASLACEVASHNTFELADKAVHAAMAAAAAAIEGAAAAAAATDAAAKAAAHEPEKWALASVMEDISKAAAETKRVIEGATEAVILVHAAADLVSTSVFRVDGARVGARSKLTTPRELR